MGRSASRAKTLTLGDVDPASDTEMDRLEEGEVASAADRVKRAVQGHQAAGIVDEKGRRIARELQPDMRRGSKTGV